MSKKLIVSLLVIFAFFDIAGYIFYVKIYKQEPKTEVKNLEFKEKNKSL